MTNQMDKDYLLELLHKYLEGRATESERELIERYYNLFASEPDVLALLSAEQKHELRKSLPADIWKSIEKEEVEIRKKTRAVMWKISLSVAAAMILVTAKFLCWTPPVHAAKINVIALSTSFNVQANSQQLPDSTAPTYQVKQLNGSIAIDGNWNKRAWRKVKPVRITNDIINIPTFHPITEVKMLYDTGSLYIIFRVQDRYTRSVTTQMGGPVWKDAAVEFFFCTDTTQPEQYFNLEINAGGTPLLGYMRVRLTPEDIQLIRIAHSLPQVVDPEIAGPITWTIECQIPLSMLAKYAGITKPAKGVTWKANFCKIAENNSNPHHMTWSPITAPHPNFHMPRYFGRIQFD
jgi:hypothetical protein